MDNLQYVLDILDVKINSPRFEQCMTAMKKYSTPWWSTYSGNPRMLVSYQIDEPVRLITLELFKKSLEQVLGRDVDDYELYYENKELREEVKNALNNSSEN